MKQLLEFIAASIVDYPDKVKVEELKEENGFTRLTLTVAPEDMGRVIGKKGRIINAIRDLIKVKAILKKEKVLLTLKED